MQSGALPAQLTSFDVLRFPMVELDWLHLVGLNADALRDDTCMLAETGAPFVMLVRNLPADRKTRQSGPLRWFKHLTHQLSARCRAVIVVEADPSRRAMMRIDTPTLEKAFGTDVFMSPDEDQADLLAQRLLETPPIPRDIR